jgi:tetratricopeptide (TPR) repeat protein
MSRPSGASWRVVVLMVTLVSACAGGRAVVAEPKAPGELSAPDDAKASAAEDDEKEPDVDALADKADAALEAKDYPTAKKLAEQVVALDPKGYPNAYVVLGDVAVAGGDAKGAVPLYQKAVSLDATDAWAVERLAEALTSLDRAKEARDLLRRFVTAHSDADADLFDALGTAELDTGHPREARAAFESALKANARDVDAFYGLALVAAAVNRPKDAVLAIKTLLALDPGRKGDVAREPAFEKVRKSAGLRALFAENRPKK